MAGLWRWLTRLFLPQGNRARVPIPFPEEILAERKPLGRCGERVACWFLEEQCGYKCLYRNAFVRISPFRQKIAGEIDLIMEDGDTLVFVEVRTRDGLGRFGPPVQSVNQRKRLRVCQAARFWMKQNNVPETRRVRFDVVSIIWPPHHVPDIEHYPNAFSWTTPNYRKGIRR